MSQPIRTCVGCRTTDDRETLHRFVAMNGTVLPDATKSAPGRGSWLHNNPDCLALARKRGAFSRSFRRSVDASRLEVALVAVEVER